SSDLCHPLEHHRIALRAETDDLEDARQRGDLVEIREIGILDLGGALGDRHDEGPLVRFDVLDEADRALPAHVHGDDGRREENGVSQRKKRKRDVTRGKVVHVTTGHHRAGRGGSAIRRRRSCRVRSSEWVAAGFRMPPFVDKSTRFWYEPWHLWQK